MLQPRRKKPDPRNPQIARAKLLLNNRLEILDSSKPLRWNRAEGTKKGLASFASLLREARPIAANTAPEIAEAEE